jgi:O-antigen/teichoic acid export membrane protein
MIKIFFGVLGGSIIKSLLPIIIIPIFIKYWGSQDYGKWITSMAASAIISLLGFGLNNFGINKCQIAFKQARTSKNKTYDSLLSLNIIIYIGAHFISVLYLSFINIFINFEDITLVLIFGFYNAASILSSYLSVSLRITEKFHIGLYISIALNIILYLGVALLVINNFSLTFVAIWMLIMVNFVSLVFYYVLHHVYKIPFRFRYSFKTFLIYINRSYKILYFQLGDYFRIQLPLLFFGIYTSAIQVVIYTVNRTLANILSQAFIIVHNTIMQKIAANFAEGNKIQQRILYKLIFYLLVPVLTLGSVILVEFYEIIINIWIGDTADSIFNLSYFKLLIASSYLYCMWNLGTIFLVSTNNFSALAKLSLLHGVGFFIFGVCGFYLFNLKGFIIAGIIAELIFGVIIINMRAYKIMNIYFQDVLFLTIFTIINIITFLSIFLYIQSNLLAFVASIFIAILFIGLSIFKNKKLFFAA